MRNLITIGIGFTIVYMNVPCVYSQPAESMELDQDTPVCFEYLRIPIVLLFENNFVNLHYRRL